MQQARRSTPGRLPLQHRAETSVTDTSAGASTTSMRSSVMCGTLHEASVVPQLHELTCEPYEERVIAFVLPRLQVALSML